MMGKRGQVTAFVVIGIVILAALAIVIFTKQDILRSKFLKEKSKLVSVPEQAEKVKILVDSCIEQTASEGIVLLASQGGYISMPDDSYPQGAGNPFSNVLEVFPNNALAVPYWFYDSPANVEKYQVPTKEVMEKELAKYIDDNIHGCLDFSNLNQQGYKFSDADPVSEVDIGDENVLVSLSYPLQIELRDFKFNFEKFYNEVEMPLGDLYNDALSIMNGESSETFLENKTLEFMAMYDKIPFSGVDFDCSPRIWTKTDVIKDFREYLETNIPFIRIKGTNYQIKDELKVFEVDARTIDKRLDANIMYSKEWPFFINFIGENSEILRGTPHTTEGLPSQFLATLFCLNNYNFVYDVKYPVLFTLSKEGLVFNFATMVVIDNNQARQNRLQLDYDFETESTICEGKAKDVSVNVLGLSDDGSYKQLDNARISYKCSSAVCDIGTSKSGQLTSKFPQCLNGYIIAEKEGFNTAKLQFSTIDSDSTTVMMDKIYDLSLDVKVVDVNGPRQLAEGESAVFNLVNKEKEYSASIVYPGVEKIKLIPGDYLITSYISVESKSGFKLDAKKIRTCFDAPADGVLGAIGITKQKCVETEMPETTLNTIIAGGANYNYNFNIDDLRSSRKVTLYSVMNKIPSTTQDFMNIEKDIQSNKEKVILPKFGNE